MDMGQRSPELGICPRPSEHATMDSHTPGIKITPLADGISMAILTLDTIEIQALMTVRGKSGSDKYVLSKRHFALIEGGGAPHQIRFQLFARRREDQPRGREPRFRDNLGHFDLDLRCDHASLGNPATPLTMWLAASDDDSFQGPRVVTKSPSDMRDSPKLGLSEDQPEWDFGSSLKTKSFRLFLAVREPWRLEESGPY